MAEENPPGTIPQTLDPIDLGITSIDSSHNPLVIASASGRSDDVFDILKREAAESASLVMALLYAALKSQWPCLSCRDAAFSAREYKLPVQ